MGWLGKKYLSLQEQITLSCDWNSTTFCITDLAYNDSVHEWKVIQAYLLGNASA